MNITLHPTLGVNPHLTFCPRCGGDWPDLMLIGNRTSIYKCRGCDTTIYGHRMHDPCPKCNSRGPHEKTGEIKEGDKLPGSLCNSCEEEVALHKEIVSEGGVYFRCKECGKSGVIKKNDFADHVREVMKIEAPNPIGVEFMKCEEHGE